LHGAAIAHLSFRCCRGDAEGEEETAEVVQDLVAKAKVSGRRRRL
jgi:hypothetical protein